MQAAILGHTESLYPTFAISTRAEHNDRGILAWVNDAKPNNFFGSSVVRGHSQTTLTIFCLSLSTYHLVDICDRIPLYIRGKSAYYWHFQYHLSTRKYLHRLINVVCECPPRQDMQALAGIMRLAHICVDGTYYLLPTMLSRIYQQHIQ